MSEEIRLYSNIRPTKEVEEFGRYEDLHFLDSTQITVLHSRENVQSESLQTGLDKAQRKQRSYGE
jgi:hypothetical protein